METTSQFVVGAWVNVKLRVYPDGSGYMKPNPQNNDYAATPIVKCRIIRINLFRCNMYALAYNGRPVGLPFWEEDFLPDATFTADASFST